VIPAAASSASCASSAGYAGHQTGDQQVAIQIAGMCRCGIPLVDGDDATTGDRDGPFDYLIGKDKLCALEQQFTVHWNSAILITRVATALRVASS